MILFIVFFFIKQYTIILHTYTNSIILTPSSYTTIRCKPHIWGYYINSIMVMWPHRLSWASQVVTNGPVRSWILHRSLILSPEHEICSYLKFCEVEGFPLSPWKTYPISNTVWPWGRVFWGIYDLWPQQPSWRRKMGRQGAGDGVAILRGQRHDTIYRIVHYLWPEPYSSWSKVVH
jgi:hypothetical protein